MKMFSIKKQLTGTIEGIILKIKMMIKTGRKMKRLEAHTSEYAIFPVGTIEPPSKIKRALFRIISLILLITLNAGLMRGMGQTKAFLNDVERSSDNFFAAGNLDFSIISSSATSTICSTNSKPREVNLKITNFGNPFKYQASSTDFSTDLCDYVLLEAGKSGGQPQYFGPLKNFDSSVVEYDDIDDWVFKMTVASNTPSNLDGQVCDYNLNFLGSQTRNNLPFPYGFSNFETTSLRVQAPYCKSSDIRSYGYWKTHLSDCSNLLPQFLGGISADEVINTQTKVNSIYNASDSIMRNKLKKQLLTMKFNITNFDVGNYYDEISGHTINQLVALVDELLRQDPPPSDNILESYKNDLDRLNNLGSIKNCDCTPPQPKNDCDLRLTKTVVSTTTSPGNEINYRLTFDNIGAKVCTGGGVLLKDYYGSDLEFTNYVSSRIPKSFSKGSGYLEWNFGSIYPNDPLITIDLKMKVSKNASCDADLNNNAKYWSNETQWGQPVVATSKVTCTSKPKNDVVINEFLPNPRGPDNAHKPGGEWVELYNRGTEPADVSGWKITDKNARHILPITINNTNIGNTIVPAGGFLVVYRNGDSDFALDNTGGDKVRLYRVSSGTQELVDSYTYSDFAPEGKSYARIPDGANNWVDPIPTPGDVNSLVGELVNLGIVIPEVGEDDFDLLDESVAKTLEGIVVESEIASSTVDFASTTQAATTSEQFNDETNIESNDLNQIEIFSSSTDDILMTSSSSLNLDNSTSTMQLLNQEYLTTTEKEIANPIYLEQEVAPQVLVRDENIENNLVNSNPTDQNQEQNSSNTEEIIVSQPLAPAEPETSAPEPPSAISV